MRASRMPAGAVMIEAVSTWAAAPGNTPCRIVTYATIVEPETHAMPTVISRNSSERVRRLR